MGLAQSIAEWAGVSLSRPLLPAPGDPESAAASTVAPVPRDPDALIERIRSGVIGNDLAIETPFDADYTASGRALDFVEQYIRDRVLPSYANTHTEVSATGLQTTLLREEARHEILAAVGGHEEEDVVLFVGTGCTGAVHKLIQVLGLYVPSELGDAFGAVRELPPERRPVVLVSHMEHHSNDVAWRESLADCVRIRAGADGLPDAAHARELIAQFRDRPFKAVSLSAGSNVTGIRPPLDDLCELFHAHGWLVFVDYAGAGAYIEVDMHPPGRPGARRDAMFFSPHKFVGGPGACGVLVARRDLFRNRVPSVPGGGTVSFVWADGQEYEPHPEHREEGGTPGILQSIRAGLAFQIKRRVGDARIEALERRHVFRALAKWRDDPHIELVGARSAAFWREDRLSIVSFNIRVRTDCGRRLILHPHFVSQVLNDLYGIQSRSGCSCAGPYGIDLLCVEGEDAATLLDLARRGYHSVKPGWVRVNFNYFLSDADVDFVADAVAQVAREAWKLLPLYAMDPRSGQWYHSAFAADKHVHSLAGGAWMDAVPAAAPTSRDDPVAYLAAAQRVYDGAADAVRAHADAVRSFRDGEVADADWPPEAERLRAFAVPTEMMDRLLRPELAAPPTPVPAGGGPRVEERMNFFASAIAHDPSVHKKHLAHIRERSRAFARSRPRG